MEQFAFSLDEFMADKTRLGKKEARKAEGVKGTKVQEGGEKSKQSTVLQN